MTNEKKYKEFDDEDEARCPFCHKEQNDVWKLFVDSGDGAEEDIECGHCGKIFTVKQSIDVSYSTWSKEHTKK